MLAGIVCTMVASCNNSQSEKSSNSNRNEIASSAYNNSPSSKSSSTNDYDYDYYYTLTFKDEIGQNWEFEERVGKPGKWIVKLNGEEIDYGASEYGHGSSYRLRGRLAVISSSGDAGKCIYFKKGKTKGYSYTIFGDDGYVYYDGDALEAENPSLRIKYDTKEKKVKN